MKILKVILTLLSIIVYIMTKDPFKSNVDKQCYDMQGKNIPSLIGCVPVKYNLYGDYLVRIFAVCDKKIITDVEGTLFVRKVGILFQDTVYYSSGELAGCLIDQIDQASYREIEKSKLYCDKKQLYFCGRSELMTYPFYILEGIHAPDVNFLDGRYFKDKKHVYNYGGTNCVKVEHANPETFKVIEVKNQSREYFHLGIDDHSIYNNGVMLAKEDIENLDLAPLDKEKIERFLK